ncbi:MAG: C-terminal binding protein [Desulfobacterales bacterium]|nr:MAG: C-terminal binding protein [Desulfobacterales bacterium]
MAHYKVVAVNRGYETYQFERDILEPMGAELVLTAEDCTAEDQVIKAAQDADAVLVREAPIGQRVIEAFQRCRIIARYGVGVDNVDLQTARKRKIYVSNVPDYGTEDVSDHAVALLLACIRQLPLRDRNLRRGIFESDIRDEIYRTTGKTLGLVGYGKIARAFHRKWRGFLPGRVLVCDPFVTAEVIRANEAEKVDLDTLLAASDYITLHTPLTPESRHIIDAAALTKMKKTAILVNTSRGAVVDETALVTALRNGQILAAGLDVFEKEPLGQDHPLVALPNVILTSHVAWYSKDSVQELQTRAAQEVRRVLAGERPVCWVNPW